MDAVWVLMTLVELAKVETAGMEVATAGMEVANAGRVVVVLVSDVLLETVELLLTTGGACLVVAEDTLDEHGEGGCPVQGFFAEFSLNVGDRARFKDRFEMIWISGECCLHEDGDL